MKIRKITTPTAFFLTQLLLSAIHLQAQVECINGNAAGFPCNGVNLLAKMSGADIGGGNGNDVWGWVNPNTGTEYVLVGRTGGTAFVQISDPLNPIYLGMLPTHTNGSSWRDIKVYKNHAFVVSEASNHGMQVFDLMQLDTVTTPPISFTETAYFNDTGIGGFITRAHNIVINETSGYAYLVGTNLCGGGLVAVNIQDPTNPQYAGCFSIAGYTHDAQCVDYIGPDTDYVGSEICFNLNGSTGNDLAIVEVSDKSDMTLIASAGYSARRYSHQGWLTEDQQYFLSNDELDESQNNHNTRTHLWDVRNLDTPVYMGYYASSEAAIDHNLYVKGNFVYQSNYRAGLRILDATNIAEGKLKEVAYFDTYPADNNPSFRGTWSNYPYFPSGTIAVNNIVNGLFLLKEQECIEIDLRVLLEGPYDPSTIEMHNGLYIRGLLPGQTPENQATTFTDAGQPYKTAPWSYSGTEGFNWTDDTYQADVVDWVLVSFRTGIEAHTQVAETAAILLQDGVIQFPKGCALPALNGIDELYIVVEHRNHIGVMTPSAIPISNGVISYDFTLADSYKSTASFGQKMLASGIWGMYAGDGNQNDTPSYDIMGADKNIWELTNGQFDEYLSPDYNLDGDINGNDKSIWTSNNGIFSNVPK